MIKLSVCLTTYNRAPLLDRTLASLASQTRIPDELIISDDCSTDDTEEAVKRWAGRFPRVRYNRNEQNLNMPGNLNRAISFAQGEYIANLHDADEYDPTLLEKWEGALDAFPSAGFVFCGIRGWQHFTRFGDGVILHDVEPLTNGRDFFERHFLHKLSSIVWGTVMARRSAYSEILPFDPAYGFISDVDMWLRMCEKWDVAYVREPLILLDFSPSPWRNFRWDRFELGRKIQLANIHRFFSSQPDRLHKELKRHRLIVQQFYFRRLLGRVYHRDWTGLFEGLRICRELGLPLRWLGAFAND